VAGRDDFSWLTPDQFRICITACATRWHRIDLTHRGDRTVDHTKGAIYGRVSMGCDSAAADFDGRNRVLYDPKLAGGNAWPA